MICVRYRLRPDLLIKTAHISLRPLRSHRPKDRHLCVSGGLLDGRIEPTDSRLTDLAFATACTDCCSARAHGSRHGTELVSRLVNHADAANQVQNHVSRQQCQLSRLVIAGKLQSPTGFATLVHYATSPLQTRTTKPQLGHADAVRPIIELNAKFTGRLHHLSSIGAKGLNGLRGRAPMDDRRRSLSKQ